MADAVVCDTCRTVGIAGEPETDAWLLVQRLHGEPQAHHFCSHSCAAEWFGALSGHPAAAAARTADETQAPRPAPSRSGSGPRLASVVAASTRSPIDIRQLGDERRGRRRGRG